MTGGWGDAKRVSCGGGEVGLLGSCKGCVSGRGWMTRTVSSVTTLSSPVPRDEVVESNVSFPVSAGEGERDEMLVGTTSGPSSSSGMTISPPREGVKCESVMVGISGFFSLSNRFLMAVATPGVFSGTEVLDFAVGSLGELSGEPNAVWRRGDRASRSRGAGRLGTTSWSKLGC